MPRIRTVLVLAALLSAAAAAPALAGPPWISIEYPVNPFDAATRSALFVVHTYHHGASVPYALAATAEGIVDGRRVRLPLQVAATSRTGVWAVSGRLPAHGSFVVTATLADDGEGSHASILVGFSGGRLLSARVPQDRREGWVIPREASREELETMLRETTAMAAAEKAAEVSAAQPRDRHAVGMLALAFLPLAGLGTVLRRR